MRQTVKCVYSLQTNREAALALVVVTRRHCSGGGLLGRAGRHGGIGLSYGGLVLVLGKRRDIQRSGGSRVVVAEGEATRGDAADGRQARGRRGRAGGGKVQSARGGGGVHGEAAGSGRGAGGDARGCGCSVQRGGGLGGVTEVVVVMAAVVLRGRGLVSRHLQTAIRGLRSSSCVQPRTRGRSVATQQQVDEVLLVVVVSAALVVVVALGVVLVRVVVVLPTEIASSSTIPSTLPL